jgi:hypothetical protein
MVKLNQEDVDADHEEFVTEASELDDFKIQRMKRDHDQFSKMSKADLWKHIKSDSKVELGSTDVDKASLFSSIMHNKHGAKAVAAFYEGGHHKTKKKVDEEFVTEAKEHFKAGDRVMHKGEEHEVLHVFSPGTAASVDGGEHDVTDHMNIRSMRHHRTKGGMWPVTVHKSACTKCMKEEVVTEAKKPNVKVHKHGGDDMYSWAVSVNGKPKWTGMGRSEAKHRAKKEIAALSAPEKKDTK